MPTPSFSQCKRHEAASFGKGGFFALRMAFPCHFARKGVAFLQAFNDN
jgi:hypothetical protein